MEVLKSHLEKIESARTDRQRNNASQAFAKASGRLIFKVGKTYVSGQTKQANEALDIVRNMGLKTQIAFVQAFIELCLDLQPEIDDGKAATFVTIQFPSFQKR